MIIDVTLPVREGMIFRLGTPPVEIRNRRFYHEAEGGEYESTTVFMPLHTATHIDVVSRDIDIPVNRFMGPGKMIDVTGIVEREVQLSDCRNREAVQKGDFVFFKTGWDRYLGSERYFAHPQLSREILDWLIETEVNMVGLDALGLGRGKNHGIFDRLLVNSGIYIIENLVNLEAVTAPAFMVYCFPLSIEKTDALPARVIVQF